MFSMSWIPIWMRTGGTSREINPGVGELQFQCSGHLRRHLSRKRVLFVERARVDPKGKSTGDPCEIQGNPPKMLIKSKNYVYRFIADQIWDHRRIFYSGVSSHVWSPEDIPWHTQFHKPATKGRFLLGLPQCLPF